MQHDSVQSAGERISMLSKEEALTRGREQGIDDYISQMNMFRVLLNFPQLAGEINRSIMVLVGSTDHVSHRLRELIIMRVAWLAESSYMWSQHWQASLWLGLVEEELAAVRNWQEADCFDSQERAVLQACDDSLLQGQISSASWQQLCESFPDMQAQIAVIACIGNWQMCAQLLKNLDVPLEDSSPVWPPDGRAP